jgi:hypothetical protein
VSPNKTLYVRDDDLSVWDRAETYAKETRQSVSALVASALDRYVPAEPDQEGMGEITVDVGEPPLAKSFAGRWLLGPDSDETRTGLDGYDAGAYWGVALTRRGRIAVVTAHCNERWPADLKVYETLDAAEEDGVPADILALAGAELGQDRVIRLDI